jgi:hypothetical protein
MLHYCVRNCSVTLVFLLPLAASPATLIHRYSFTSNANDSVGTANGTLQGSATIAGGKVVVNGASHAVSYVSLPAGLVSSLSAVTIEAWETNSTSPDNVHLFSFSNGSWTGSDETIDYESKMLIVKVHAFDFFSADDDCVLQNIIRAVTNSDLAYD